MLLVTHSWLTHLESSILSKISVLFIIYRLFSKSVILVLANHFHLSFINLIILKQQKNIHE